MTSLSNLLLIATCILLVGMTLKSSESAIIRKSVDFARINKKVQVDIEKSFQQTLKRLAEFQMALPAKIVMQRLKNIDGNTFNDPFLVGNSQLVTSSLYVSDTVSEWCSGVISRSTRKYFEHKNRRIDVVFDCNRPMLLPSLRSIVRNVLILMAVNAGIGVMLFVVKILKFRHDKIESSTTIEHARSAEMPLSIDDYIVDDDSLFLETIEKWNASKLESCYD